jgi:hypothetical protein
MPRGDGTGPAGFGPMTGRAAGYCAGYSVPGYMNAIPGGGFFGRGRGRGRGFRNMYWATGMPGGIRAGLSYPAWGGIPPYPYSQAISPEQEAEALKNQAQLMQDNLNALNERILELEKISSEKQKSDK